MLGVNNPALPASLRRTNQRTILSLLLRLGSATSADLAKAAGISQPTAGKITAELLKLGVLQKTDDTEEPTRRLGRPGQLLRLNSDQARFLTVEVGIRQTRISALPVGFSRQDSWTREIPTVSSPHAWLTSLHDVSKDLVVRQLWGVLVSVPGIVDEDRGKVLFSPNLHWLEKVNLPELIHQAWDLPVELVQEIRALALGQIAAGPPGEDFLLVDFGQGVGGAMVLDGKLYNPAMPLSGELGHTPVPGATRRCGCGAVGCLETLVSESGLMETFRQYHGGRPRWADLQTHVQSQGVPAWLEESMDAAARVIAGALNIVGIHQVVVTGLLEQLPQGVFQHLAREIRKGSMWERFGQVSCVLEPRRRAAGLVAAGLDRLVLPTHQDTGLLLPRTHPRTQFGRRSP